MGRVLIDNIIADVAACSTRHVIRWNCMLFYATIAAAADLEITLYLKSQPKDELAIVLVRLLMDNS